MAVILEIWGFNTGKLKLSQIPYPMVHCGNRSLEGPGRFSYGQYLDRTLGKFPPLYGPNLSRWSTDKQRVSCSLIDIFFLWIRQQGWMKQMLPNSWTFKLNKQGVSFFDRCIKCFFGLVDHLDPMKYMKVRQCPQRTNVVIPVSYWK